jgi:hypothetical protein
MRHLETLGFTILATHSEHAHNNVIEATVLFSRQLIEISVQIDWEPQGELGDFARAIVMSHSDSPTG